MDIEENKKLDNMAYDKMAYYIGARDHSLQELYAKLIKNFPKDVVDRTLDKAIDNGWIISPKELAEKTYEMLNRKHKGYYYITQYLQKKGLPIVDKDETVELDKACAIITNQFKELEKLNYEEKQKAFRLLKNRGFDGETIKKVIYEIY